MATTTVIIEDEGGILSANLDRVNVVTGDTVTFTADPDADCALYFSAAATQILSPYPDPSGIQLSGGDSVSYEFTSGEPGQYCVYICDQQSPAPGQVNCGSSGDAATLTITAGAGFDGPGDPPDQLH